MKYLRNFFRSELNHYNKLHYEGKIIFGSSLLYNLASPILGTFTGCYLWRQSASIILLSTFQLMIFGGTIVGFYLNGLLLKKFSPSRLYFTGCLIQGIATALLIFLPKLSSPEILFFGIINGISSGIFWANRTYISSKYIQKNERIYFSSINSIQGILTGLLMPLTIGWMIVFGETRFAFDVHLAYRILAILMVILLTWSGYIIMKISNIRITSDKKPLFLTRPSTTWKRLRVFSFILGFSNSIEMVIPGLFIMMFVGKENFLGSFQSFSSLFVAGALLFIGKTANREHRIYIFTAGISLSIIASTLFGSYFSVVGILLYSVINALAGPFRWVIYGPMWFDILDMEERRFSKHRYGYVCDEQLFLNLGRMAALFLFMRIALINPPTALRISPLLSALPQIFILTVMLSLEKRLVRDEILQKGLFLQYMALAAKQNPSHKISPVRRIS